MSDLLYPNAIILKIEFYQNEYNPYRRIKLIHLSNILGKTKKFQLFDYNKQSNIISQIEKSCYEKACDDMLELEQEPDWENQMFINIYNYICGNLFENIDPESEINSTYLLEKILNQDIDLENIGYMKSDELCPEKSKEIKRKIKEQACIKYSTKTSTMYRCGKCKKNECVLERMQTRSLDELTNHRATCVFCKHTWII